MWHHDLDLTLAIRLFGSSLASDPAGLSPSRERVAPFFRLGEFVFFRESCQVSPSPPGAKRRRLHRTWAPRGSFPDAATRALRQRLIGIPGGEHNKVAPERESTGQSADAPSTVKALRRDQRPPGEDSCESRIIPAIFAERVPALRSRNPRTA
jgi:hypothetical protein